MRLILLSVVLVLSGCHHGVLAEHWPQSFSAETEAEFLVHAMNATPMERERLWREAAALGDGGEQRSLRIALLQSLPGHSGHAPGTAHRELQELRDTSTTPGISAIASLRLSEMRNRTECELAIKNLEERLSRITDIERELEDNEERENNHE